MKSAGFWAYVIAICAAAFVIMLYYRQIPLLEGIENKTWDTHLRLAQSSSQPDSAIAIIAIDEKSIDEIGRFPWSREIYADFINVLNDAGAGAVLLDVLFSEPESSTADKKFAGALANFGRSILSEFLEYDSHGNPVVHKKNLAIIRSASTTSGHINLFPDEDGVIRWSRLSIPFEGSNHLALALHGASAAMGNVPVSVEPYVVKIGDKTIPVDEQSRMLINFAATSGKFETFSFSDILNRRVPKEHLRGRILFVGSTAAGIYDLRVTPFSANTPGVLLNAIITESIVRGAFLKKGGSETLADLTAVIIISLLTSAIVLRTGFVATLPLLVLLGVGYAGFTHVALQYGSRLSIFYPMTSMALTFIGAAFVRFRLLDKKAREIRSMFSRFVSTNVVNRLVKNPALACISGDNRMVTILFADIQNYTSFSERHEPKETVKVLNMYLSVMVSVIMEYDGTLDKFMGDGILAYWNAPLEQPDHPELAVRCALEMIKRGEELRERIATECGEPLTWGIGINTGEVVAGIIGAEGKKMEYTVIGDNVNLTYRIQNKSRESNTPIITRSLYDLMDGSIIAERLEPLYVRGKEMPVEVFALKGMKN